MAAGAATAAASLTSSGEKLAPRPGHAGDDADGAGVEENGHEQDRPDALRLEPGAVPDPRILEHVGHDERLLGLEHTPREPLPQAEALLELDVLAGGTRLGTEGQRARPLAAEPDADDVDAEPGLRDVGEALEHLSEIEGGGDEPARLGEDLELAGGGQVGFARWHSISAPATSTVGRCCASARPNARGLSTIARTPARSQSILATASSLDSLRWRPYDSHADSARELGR